MAEHHPAVSAAFKTFFAEAPQHAKAWMEVAERLAMASALDAKTRELAYLWRFAYRSNGP